MNILILISGSGSTMECVIKACQAGIIPNSQVVHVIASKDSAGGIAKAEALGVSVTVLKLHKDFNEDTEKFGQAILGIAHKYQADLIAQLGWLVKTPGNVVEEYQGRIINQHPGILCPGHFDFGGPGMHGLAVHEAIIRFRNKVNRPLLTEAVVHLVTGEYDKGIIIGLRSMLIQDNDTAETLSKRLLPIEHELVVEVISRFATGQTILISKPKSVITDSDLAAYDKAITEAKQLYNR